MVSRDGGIKHIGLVYNARVERSLPLAKEIKAWLTSKYGVEAW